MKERVRVGHPEIDSQIAILDQIDNVANAQFKKQLTQNEARQQLIYLLMRLSHVGVTMFFAPFVESEEDMEAVYDELEEKYPAGPDGTSH